MNFAQRLGAEVGKQLSNLKVWRDKRSAQAEERSKQQLADAQVKTAREKISLQLKREKMITQRELYEEQLATQQAKQALDKSRRAVGALTVGEQLSEGGISLCRGIKSLYMMLVTPPKRHRRTTKKTKTRTRRA